MKSITVTVLHGDDILDREGDVFDLAGVQLPKGPVPVLLDFHQLVGTATVHVEDTRLVAELRVTDDLPVERLTPAVGGRVLQEVMQADRRVVTQWRLFSVGMCTSPNVDARIQPWDVRL